MSSSVLLAALLASAPSPCQPPSPGQRILIHVDALDPALAPHTAIVDHRMRAALGKRHELVEADVALRSRTEEAGLEARVSDLVEARIILRRAEDGFRELEDEAALELIARATTRLAAIHQHPGALELLARAHLLAGAIYLARNRVTAGRTRLQRAIDLDPNLTPDRARFAPRVIAELAAVRSASGTRASGRVVIASTPSGATAFVDGRRVGRTPLALNNVGVGRHLLRVAIAGYRSDVSTVQVASGSDANKNVVLAPDAELALVASIPGRLRLGQSLAPVAEVLKARAGADRVVFATLHVAPQLSSTANATVGATIAMRNTSPARAGSLDPAAIEQALATVLSCQGAPEPPPIAPQLAQLSVPDGSRPQPVPQPEPWWASRWLWATAAVFAVAASGSIVALRTAGGPPESVKLNLIPRP